MTDGAVDGFAARAARLDRARAALTRLPGEASAVAAELVAALEEHHAAVLRSLVTLLRADARGRELLYEAVDDPEVHAALVKAGIVRPSLAMRALQVLDAVRPYLTSHNGDVELVRIEDGVAHVRLLGACGSCGSATETLRDLVAEALLEHLPELSEVREVPPATAPSSAFIPVTALSVGRRKAGEVPGAPGDPPPGPAGAASTCSQGRAPDQGPGAGAFVPLTSPAGGRANWRPWGSAAP